MVPLQHSPHAGRRGGFTLVELLVAAGLSVLVMAILATAFGQGMETLSHLKSTVTLSQQLRGVERVIRDDLDAPHLEDGSTGAPVRVSNAKKIGSGWNAPDKGYLVIGLPTSPGGATDTNFALERTDATEPSSYRATNHTIRFTARLSGATPRDFFTATIPLSVPTNPASPSRLPQLMQQSETSMVNSGEVTTKFVGVWAEVAYFLDPTGLSTSVEGSTGVALPLYTLRRRVRVLAPREIDETVDDTTTTPEVYPEVSYRSNPAPAKVNTPSSVTNAMNRTAMAKFDDNDPARGSDVLLSNVVSMQIMPMRDAGTTAGSPNTFLDDPGAPWTYDTASPIAVTPATTPPSYISLKAVQIKLRVYDVRNRVTRQVTIAQDL